MSGKFLLQQQAGQLHGTVRSQDVTISGTFPTLLPPDPLAQRKDFLLHNGSGEIIYLGGNDVDKFNGIPLADAGVIAIQLGRGEFYAVSTSSTVSGVRILEIA